VRELEQYAVDHADLIVTTSERDSAVYRNEFGSTASHVVAPNGTYEDAIRSHRPDSAEASSLRSQYGLTSDATVCLFMGSNYQPNVLASKHVIKFARELPSTEFVIMGSVGNDFDPQNLPSNVTITGYIDEKFESHFDMADIALNPMTTGGGTNIKVLDYFARSLPVVSTPFGVRGIQVETDNAIVIADIEDFSNAISTLASNTGQQKVIGDNARQLAANRYTWEGASIRLRDRLLELIKTTAD
jgi:glycosyltransferase involved in cell wall biosynthesis